MNRNFYCTNILALIIFLSGQASASDSPSDLSITTNNESSNSISGKITSDIVTPDIDVTVETTTVYVWFNMQSEGSNIEIYRSTSATTGFQLVATILDTQGYYADRNLKGRTTFYYKARAINGSQTSGFSDTEAITTYANYYPPTLTAQALDPYTVELTFTDNSYYDQTYEIGGKTSESLGNDFDYHVSMLDSGRTIKIIHYPATPGKTYTYSVLTVPEQYDAPYAEANDIATVTMPRDQFCTETGGIERERWDNVSGYGINLIPISTNPSSITTLTSFSSPVNEADNYGARVRGFVCAPATGDYVFWITSDDNSELWLSTDELPANKKLIASSKWTGFNGAWDKYPTQQSASIRLEAGKKYYIEALHKESAGRDHLAVGWKLPNGTLERPIPGSRLSKFPRENKPPNVVLTNPKHGETYTAPANITVSANASDPDGTVASVKFYINNSMVFQDNVAPYQYQWNNISVGEYSLWAVATDNQGAESSFGAYIYVKAPPQCAATGKITREYWASIPGTSLSSVPFDAPANYYTTYTSFETEQKNIDDYGSRMRGYVCVPATGNYTFWISSDDQSQLYLSTDDNPANKKLIASVSTYTGYRVYNKFASQKSVPISLVAGQRYYIEALHKEGKGYDFISVAWQLPDGTLEAPIPGNRLIDIGSIPHNRIPVVSITSPAEGTIYTSAPADITLKASASDPDTGGAITRVDFYLDNNLVGTDTSSPYEFVYNDVPIGQHVLAVRAYDNSQDMQYADVRVTVQNTSASCTDTGKIYWEVWNGVPGYNISDVPFGQQPQQRIELANFEIPANHGDDYGSRIRGYVCPARTGEYTFHIASDDASELWLSTDANPANKRKIAYLLTATQPRNWGTGRPEQHSAQILLVAGTKYYVEALHKEARGGDHLSVAWRFVSDATFEGPIPGSRLIPYEIPAPNSSMTARTVSDGSEEALMSEEESSDISVYPNPTSSREINISLGNLQPAVDPRVEIISSAGRIIQSQTASCEGCNEIQFTLDNNVVPGLYLVNVVMNRRRVTKKLQVK